MRTQSDITGKAGILTADDTDGMDANENTPSAKRPVFVESANRSSEWYGKASFGGDFFIRAIRIIRVIRGQIPMVKSRAARIAVVAVLAMVSSSRNSSRDAGLDR